ncbi:hypothetical protein SMB34_00810 [Thalassospira permensis NBRC 106175]|uniref:Uncharacterized protein n=1 Tax=Thalassospira permensis NBRC 106175 TaxID=1353532 RepID=A0ABR4TTT8_9PROT|nr:hypothetical protein SMB34_00810 [Thalassospira permensis NBRC 106175]
MSRNTEAGALFSGDFLVITITEIAAFINLCAVHSKNFMRAVGACRARC